MKCLAPVSIVPIGLLLACSTGAYATKPPTIVEAAPAGDVTPPAVPVDPSMLGFRSDAGETQRQLERELDAALSAENLAEWMKSLSARPHHVGSPHGSANADLMADLFRSWGYDVEIEEFEVLFPTPKTRRLELLGPKRFRARLAEPTVKGDAVSHLRSERLPPYNAYSIDGDVTGELVYVNYGIKEDYEQLDRLGVAVEGKVVITRYGRSWRGIKPKLAAEHGAIGCIIYSDPRDDGYFQGETYPAGPYRPDAGVQRGSVIDMPLFPGDPLTPGVGAKPGVKRLDRKSAPTLTKIPVLPISYQDAEPLLRALAGQVAPEQWRGALPITYRVGPGPARVRLHVEFDWKTVTARNVVAKLVGSELPDEWVVRGNHHDAWVAGARDPVSGLVVMLEEARAIATLAKDGKPPRRTLVYAAWDAEEVGLFGSTEWVEHHAEALTKHAVAYVNGDSNARGFLQVGGSHSLERFVNQVAREVDDPQTGASVLERARSAMLVRGKPEEREIARTRADLPLNALGSGSDYTPFIQHLGVPSLNLGFGGEGDGGSYHSTYDSFEHFTRFGDPGFRYGVALARVSGRIMLRLANATALPMAFSPLARQLGEYLVEIEKLTDEMREQTSHNNALLDQGRYRAAADPTKTYVPPKREQPVPHLAFAPLHNAIASLTRAATEFDAAVARAVGDRSLDESEHAAALNAALRSSERALTRTEGLPDRPWYRHYIYAPGYYTGYGVKTLPGVREAVEARSWELAEQQVTITARVIDTLASHLEAATAQLEGNPGAAGR